MLFKILQIENFLSYKNTKIEFKPGLYLVDGKNLDEGGSNGAGKSGIWEALAWSLFGVTTRGLSSGEVVNRSIGKDCRVSLQFRHNNKDCIVTRYRDHASFSNRVLFVVGDKDLEQGTAAITQKRVEEFLGFDLDFFKFTVMFSQGNAFNFVNETDKSQKAILSKVMRLDFDKYFSVAKDECMAIDRDKNTLTMRKNIIIGKLLSDGDLAELEKKSEEYADTCREKVSAAKAEIVELDKEIASIVVATYDPDEEKRLIEGRKKIDEILAKVNTKANELAAKEIFLKRSLKQIDSVAGISSCPTCFQSVEYEKIIRLKKPIEDELAGIDHTAINKVKSEVADKLDGIRKAIDKNKEDRLTADFNTRSLKTLRQVVKDKESEVQYWEAAENPYEAQLIQAKNLIKKSKKEIAEIEEQMAELEVDLPFYKFWYDAFADGGIKSYVFDLICGSLSKRTNDYLQIMGRANFGVNFTTQTTLKSGDVREKFQCAVSKDGAVVPYEACSGGEQRRVSIAVDNALADIMKDYYGQKINLMVFDEQTNFLDESGRRGFFKLVKKLSKDSIVYVVDHDNQHKANYDDVIMVEKENGFSRIK